MISLSALAGGRAVRPPAFHFPFSESTGSEKSEAAVEKALVVCYNEKNH